MALCPTLLPVHWSVGPNFIFSQPRVHNTVVTACTAVYEPPEDCRAFSCMHVWKDCGGQERKLGSIGYSSEIHPLLTLNCLWPTPHIICFNDPLPLIYWQWWRFCGLVSPAYSLQGFPAWEWLRLVMDSLGFDWTHCSSVFLKLSNLNWNKC